MAFKMKAKGFGNNPFKKNFPDLTGDGKVTKADVLKGRGVFKKVNDDDKVVPKIPKKPDFMSDDYFKSLSDKYKLPISDIKNKIKSLSDTGGGGEEDDFGPADVNSVIRDMAKDRYEGNADEID